MPYSSSPSPASARTGSSAVVAFDTDALLGIGGVFNSDPIVFGDGDFSQLQTEVTSDQDGSMLFRFYADDAATDLIRSLTVPYLAADGYRQFGAPTFGRSARYRFTNDSGVGQSDFYFSTKAIRGAVSPQVLALDAFVSPTMIATVGRSVLTAPNPAGQYGNVSRSEAGNLAVDIAGPLSSFGEVRTVQLSPVAQIDAVYGVLSNAETFIDAVPGTGSADTDGLGNFRVQTGAGLGGYGVLRTRRALRYRPGQGSKFTFTAIFDEASKVASSLQAAGAFNSTSGFFVGFNGASEFGVMHRTGGYHETRTLTITVSAGGAETLDLELNGVTYSIPVTAGTAPENAAEIVAWMLANQTAWETRQNGDTVILFGLAVGPLAGAYSAANQGGGETIAGTIAQDRAGVANAESWVYQGAFSVDQLDGAGPSGMTLAPDVGNVYEIDLQYLGYGAVEMRIENPATGRLFTFHRFDFAGLRTVPTLTNPTLKVGWIVASLGSTTDLQVRGGSAMAGVEGKLHPFRRPQGYSFQRASVAATLTSLFAIRVRSVFRGVAQLSEVLPRLAFAAPAGTKACQVKFLLNPTFSAATVPDWQYISEDDSIVEVDTVGSTFTDNGTELATLIVPGGGGVPFDFSALAEEGINPLHLERGDVLVIAAVITGGGGSAVTASLTWLED